MVEGRVGGRTAQVLLPGTAWMEHVGKAKIFFNAPNIYEEKGLPHMPWTHKLLTAEEPDDLKDTRTVPMNEPVCSQALCR